MRREFPRILFCALLSLLALPVAALLLGMDAQWGLEDRITRGIGSEIQELTTPAERAEAKRTYEGLNAQAACALWHASGLQLSRCSFLSNLPSIQRTVHIARWLIAAGVGTLLAMLAFSWLAFKQARWQRWSAQFGWRFVQIATAVLLVCHGLMLVWLCYAVFAWNDGRYQPDFVTNVGVLVAVAVGYVALQLFRRTPPLAPVTGALLTADEAPQLHALLDEVATRVGTPVPDQIVLGIHGNAFVSSLPLELRARPNERPIQCTGRTLYLARPLLRLLNRAELGAVLTHELAHFRHGDTEHQEAVGPVLAQFNRYLSAMKAQPAGLVILYPMVLFRMLIELAVQRDSRSRERAADALAASHYSGAALAAALVRITAYDQRARELHEQWCAQATSPDKVTIALALNEELADYAKSAHFDHAVRDSRIGHPFDSHPPLHIRLSALTGMHAEPVHLRRLAAASVEASWLTGVAKEKLLAVESAFLDDYLLGLAEERRMLAEVYAS